MSVAGKAADIRAALLKPVMKTDTVKLERLNIELRIMEMDAGRLEQYESLIYQVGEDGKVTSNTDHMNAKIAVMSIVDDSGQLVFTPDDIDALSRTYGKDLKQIANTAATLSGLYSGETVEKNSATSRAKDS